eukprot:m.5399 g.5399  ORF g.5399 m.5399 type:complete len:404 (-) comp4381_c0_seq1:230-1441(-)
MQPVLSHDGFGVGIRSRLTCTLLTLPLLLSSTMTTACPSIKVVWQPAWSQINQSSFPGNKYGLEDGIVVRRADGGLSMLVAEMYDDPRWVAMRLGVYKSVDGLHWERLHGLRKSTANFNGTDQHAASWGPFFLHDPTNDTWVLSYVGYRSAPNNSSGWLENFQGIIFTRYASETGDTGLDSDFGDSEENYFDGDKILIAPDDFNVNGPWPHRCQGMQGTDSFYPFQLNDKSWAAFAGTSFQSSGRKVDGGKWPVSLATAPRLSGPWTRYNPGNTSAPADAPCVDINNGFTENPVVSRRPDDATAFHAVYDDLADEGMGFGYVCSDDGINWGKEIRVPVEGGTRTPFGLVPLSATELTNREADVIAFGVLNASGYHEHNTSLQWAFYTRGGWEGFHASIVQLSW